MSFQFIDLFAGIGGFHAALGAAGGTCVFASEIDTAAASVYERNWASEMRIAPGRPAVEGDIIPLTEPRVRVPEHDVLAAGFPCQPFSKSGYQRGMAEARGTLFWNICRILQRKKPKIVLLENVRNIAGPRHRNEWDVIITSLRQLGYRVSDEPTVFSPHLLPKELGGTPQVRERVFIVGTYVGAARAKRETDVGPTVENRPIPGWDPMHWDLERDLLLDDSQIDEIEKYRLSDAEIEWIEIWDEFITELRDQIHDERLPGFPIWADDFRSIGSEELIGLPRWKSDFLRKNSGVYERFPEMITEWKRRHDDLSHIPPSRRKLEWQAQQTGSIWETVLQFRPSGIRAKRPTYLPALVAINQTSIIAWRQRRITPREAARLQGLPDWFDFGDQPDSVTYKQLGNGVAVGAAYHVFREHVRSNSDEIPESLTAAVIGAGSAPTLEKRPASLSKKAS